MSWSCAAKANSIRTAPVASPDTDSAVSPFISSSSARFSVTQSAGAAPRSGTGRVSSIGTATSVSFLVVDLHRALPRP